MKSFRRGRTGPIGLHLGTRTAVLAQLCGRPGNYEVYEMASGELPSTEGLTVEQQDKETAQALRKLMADYRFRGHDVVSCLGTQDLFVQNVRLPQLPAEEVAKMVKWEAEERLPYPVADAEIRHLMAGQVRQDSNVKQEVVLLACHQGVIRRHLAILEGAGLQPRSIEIEPSAVVRSLQQAESPTRKVFLNLGEDSTMVAIVEGQQILFVKSIVGGGRQYDQAVARNLDLRLDEAIRLRSSVVQSRELDSGNEVHRSVIDAIRPHLEAMTSEIELCLRYYKVTFRGKPLDQIVVTGSEASPWLIEFLEARLETPCSAGNPLNALKKWPTSGAVLERPWPWAIALGLSLKSIDEGHQS